MSILGSFAFCEVVLRVLGLGYGSIFAHGDPVVHHIYQSDSSFIRYDVAGLYPSGHEVRIDSYGLVVNPNEEPYDWDERVNSTQYRVAVMGDSFVEGHYQPHENSLVGPLEARARENVWVKNFGISSFSPVLHFLLWDYRVKQMQPTHVVVVLYENDVRDDEDYHATAILNEAGLAKAVPGNTEPFRIVARHSYVLRLLNRVYGTIRWNIQHGQDDAMAGDILELYDEDMSLSQRYVALLNEKIRRSGASLFLTAVPSRARVRTRNPDAFEHPEFSDRWKEWALDHEIPFIDLLPSFYQARRDGKTLFLDGDIHFTAEGNTVAVDTIASVFPELFHGSDR
jgi:hypothetical protein